MNAITMSASQAKLKFGAMILTVQSGTPIIVEKNDEPAIVCISIDDYEDYLELNDKEFQKSIGRSKREIERGEYYTMDDLYDIHKKTIRKEAKNSHAK
ncbi:MAG: type II toxin-antitoxin system prevent-host-death family antitoxin [Candidatus Peregrinibacteria bacterium]|nr:type II toxin-antitoxin system prevent-host-death family antitoxin [Candidatus Peregrinibacteria bacterium]MDZ4244845.1 type II toxin-antitoxin system prevent-host-death family antitoxin [Candidatus Gracilibacteria bacterium]